MTAKESMDVDDAIDQVIQRGEEKTQQLNAKFSNLAFDDLHNFKSENPGTREWEGQVFGKDGKKPIFFLEPTKRERKINNPAEYAVAVAPKRNPKKLRLKGQV